MTVVRKQQGGTEEDKSKGRQTGADCCVGCAGCGTVKCAHWGQGGRKKPSGGYASATCFEDKSNNIDNFTMPSGQQWTPAASPGCFLAIIIQHGSFSYPDHIGQSHTATRRHRISQKVMGWSGWVPETGLSDVDTHSSLWPVSQLFYAPVRKKLINW